MIAAELYSHEVVHLSGCGRVGLYLTRKPLSGCIIEPGDVVRLNGDWAPQGSKCGSCGETIGRDMHTESNAIRETRFT